MLAFSGVLVQERSFGVPSREVKHRQSLRRIDTNRGVPVVSIKHEWNYSGDSGWDWFSLPRAIFEADNPVQAAEEFARGVFVKNKTAQKAEIQHKIKHLQRELAEIES